MEPKEIQLENFLFLQDRIGIVAALHELGSIKTSVAIKHSIIKTIRNIDECREAYVQTRAKIQEQNCKKDENGKLIIDKNKYDFDDPSKENACTEEVIELANLKVPVKIFPVSEEELMANENISADLILRLGEFASKQ